MIALADSFYIYGGYVVTAAVIAAYVASVVRRGRKMADRVDDHEKYWT